MWLRWRSWSQRQWFGGSSVREGGLGQYNIFRVVVGTTGAEHERVNAHAHVLSLGFDALPDEHASALDSTKGARLGAYLVVVAALQVRSRIVAIEAMRTPIETGQGWAVGILIRGCRFILKVVAATVRWCDKRRRR